jgi:hypothetical protein
VRYESTTSIELNYKVAISTGHSRGIGEAMGSGFGVVVEQTADDSGRATVAHGATPLVSITGANYADVVACRLVLLLLAGCGGATVGDLGDASARDASLSDAGVRDGAPPADTAEDCPQGTPAIPSAAVYACDAGAPPDAGCAAAHGDPNAPRDPHIYPLGCVVTLPVVQGACAGVCCGPQTCMCQNASLPGGAQFLCPL